MISIHLTDEQLPLLARLISESPQLAQLVAGNLRKRKDTYTIGEAAQKLRVSYKTISNRIKAKTIPVVPNIRPPRIPAAFIDRLVNLNPEE